MNCKLCHAERELRKSHVIPEFMYAALYDDKHRFHVLSLDAERRNSLAQKGLREKLLCSFCEQKFGNYERHVSLALNGGIPLDFDRQGHVLIARGVDYKAFRMFQLSILWRAGISTLPFFDKVTLGPHAETLRLMLLHEDTGQLWRYESLVFALIHQGAVLADLIVQPAPVRVRGDLGYRFVFGGLVWFFFVTAHRQKNLDIGSLTPAGEFRVVESDLAAATFIKGFAAELDRQGKI